MTVRQHLRGFEQLRGLVALAVLGMLVIGPPAFLATAVGWPLPTTLPTIDEAWTRVQLGVPNEAVVKALALAAWLLWAYLAVAIGVEVLAAVRGRAAQRLPAVGPMQVAIRRLVVATTLVVASGAAPFRAPATAAPSPMALPTQSLALALPAAPAVPTEAPPQTHDPDVGNTSPPEADEVGSQASVSEQATRPDAPRVVVGRHDSYWAIAERVLGDGFRWREVRDANLGRSMPDGYVVTADSDLLRPGWALRLPEGATVTAADEAEPDDVGNGQARPEGGRRQSPTPGGHDGSPSATASEVAVVEGNSMWRLAERYLTSVLGRPPSVPEVAIYWADFVEANRPRFHDPGNADLIHPGQRFTLPPLPPSLAPAAAVEPADPDGVDGTEAGGNESATRPDVDAEPFAASDVDRSADGTAAEEPEVPPPRPPRESDGSLGTTAARAEADPPPPGDRAGTADAEPVEGRRQPGEPHGGFLALLAGGAGSALAVGVVRSIRRRRRRRRHDAPGMAPAPGRQEDAHRVLIALADEDRHDRRRRLLDHLAEQVAATGQTCRPLIIQDGAEHVDVLLDRPTTPAPPGWEPQGSGAVWAATPDLLTVEVAANDTHADACPAATPLLVSVGALDEEEQLLIDLEAAGVVALVGEQSTAEAVARAIVTELASSSLADGAQVVVLGTSDLAVAGLDRVTVVDSWHEAAATVSGWAAQSASYLRAHGWPNAFVARGATGVYDDGLLPVVAVAAAHPPDGGDALDGLLGPDGAGATAVVVVGAVPDGALIVECEPDRLALPQLGLTCRPTAISPEDVEVIVDVLDEAGSPEGANGELLSDPPPNGSAPGNDSPASAEPYDDPPWDLLVRVLGDITIEGAPPLTAKQTAVVTYIALHGDGGVTVDKLEQAVWLSATSGVHRKRVANTISDCRRVLGARFLPLSADRRYVVGPGVLTDVDLFERRVTAAAALPPEQAVSILHGALSLVTGPVFTSRRADSASFGWVDVENWVARWEPKFTGLAQHLSTMYLDIGEPEMAVQVAEHALTVVPTDVGATETLMRAHAATGNVQAIEGVFQAHLAALAQLDLDDPAESTRELYEQLRRSAPQ